MAFVRGAWKILVGIKDGLVLLFLLAFFAIIVAALSARPNAASVEDGALLLSFKGSIVEEPEQADPFSALVSSEAPVRQYRLSDVIRAIDTASDDDRIKAIVLDLDRYTGAGYAATDQLVDALARAKKKKKPIYAYATAYTDSSYRLAVMADQIWADSFGGAIFSGPGGNRLYYKGLIDKFDINAHIYRVGTFKSAVEPYLRSNQSEEAGAALRAVLDPLWQHWQDEVAKARPKAQFKEYIADPARFFKEAKGNSAQIALDLGLVDKIGNRNEFGDFIAKKVGKDEDKERPGTFAHNSLDNWLAANPADESGDEIGVVTIAGTIVDTWAGPGTASGPRIEKLLYEGLEHDNLKALVVRVDSPGGSALASEKIRVAIDAYRKKGIPVVVSMSNLAASGGYWVAMSSDYIYAEPTTITGSIGVFAMLPSFEKVLGRYGVTSDGVKTTPLTGQPDLFGGFNDTIDVTLQSSVENNYHRFLTLVSKGRGKSVEEVDAMAQGRIWDGGTARQKGLVDGFGSLDDALKEAAKRAKLGDDWHPYYFRSEATGLAKLMASLAAPPGDDDNQAAGGDIVSFISIQRETIMAQLLSDLQGLTQTRGVQARCMECSAMQPAVSTKSSAQTAADMTTLQWLASLLD